MLDLYINCYSECKMKEYYQELATSDLKMIMMPDVTYVVVEDEQHQKHFIFGVLGKAKLIENSLFAMNMSCTLKGDGWVSIMQYEDAAIYIETPDHIWMMLNIIKENQDKTMETIQKKVEKYCKVNQVHNYANDFIVAN